MIILIFVLIAFIFALSILVISIILSDQHKRKKQKQDLAKLKPLSRGSRMAHMIHHRNLAASKRAKRRSETLSNPTKSYTDYIKNVYPLSRNQSLILNQLQFYYQDLLSKDIISNFGSKYPPVPDSNRNYEPPDLNQLWVPIWYPPVAFVKNGYLPKKFWKGDINGTPDQRGTFFEVMHVPDDDQNFYTVFGTWFYVVRGTGVWFEAGPRSLVAHNKMEALYLLGLKLWEIANLFADAQFMINPITSSPTLGQLASGQVTPIVNFEGAELNEKVYNMLKYYFKTMKELRQESCKEEQTDQFLQKMYMIDRINNSADYDETINFLARTQGFDSVHFTTQANGNGGWTHELVFVMQKMFLGTDEKRMATLRNRLYIADPISPGCSKRKCDFTNDDNYLCLSCGQQTAIWNLCNITPTPPTPPTPS